MSKSQAGLKEPEEGRIGQRSALFFRNEHFLKEKVEQRLPLLSFCKNQAIKYGAYL
jgi:hypothetical protein